MSEQTLPVKPRPTARERALERLHGKPMPELLASTFNQHGNIKGTAEALDASRFAVERWLDKWGVEIVPAQAVLPDDETATTTQPEPVGVNK